MRWTNPIPITTIICLRQGENIYLKEGEQKEFIIIMDISTENVQGSRFVKLYIWRRQDLTCGEKMTKEIVNLPYAGFHFFLLNKKGDSFHLDMFPLP